MTYLPPVGEVNLHLRGAYTAPVGEVNLNLGGLRPPFQYAGFMVQIGVPWRAGAIRDRQGGIAWGSGSRRDRQVAVRWGSPSSRDRELAVPWESAATRDTNIGIPWDSLSELDREVSMPWRGLVPLDQTVDVPWDGLRALDAQPAIPWRQAGIRNAQARIPWRKLLLRDLQAYVPWGRGRALQRETWIPWGPGRPPPNGASPSSPPPPPPPPPSGVCYAPPVGVVRLRLGGTYVPPIGEVNLRLTCGGRYYFLTSTLVTSSVVTVQRVSDNATIDVEELSLETDEDSWTWTLSLRFNTRAAMLMVKPEKDAISDVRITINGHEWIMMLERAGEVRAHGANSWRGTGRSRTALLQRLPTRSLINASPATASQLATDEIFGTGFTLQWDVSEDGNPIDWLVPAGAFSYDNLTPLAAVLKIAESIKAVVQAAPNSDTLIVQSRYPHNPWGWDSADPDLTLEGGSLEGIEDEWQPGQNLLGVYLRGQNQGKQSLVRRLDSPGTPDVVLEANALLTADEAHRERGRVEIAISDDQTRLSVRNLPLLADPEPPGLVLPGQLVRLIDPVYGEYSAKCKSVRVTVSKTEDGRVVRQHLELERHHSWQPETG